MHSKRGLLCEDTGCYLPLPPWNRMRLLVSSGVQVVSAVMTANSSLKVTGLQVGIP